MTQSSTAPTHEELLERAARIAEVVDREVDASERNNEFGPAFADVIHETQVNRLLRPRAYGGFGMGPRTFAEVVRTVARRSAAGAWLTYFYALHEQWVSYLHPKARREIFDSGGLVADIFGPVGQVVYVDGGVELSGRWNWGSGIAFCEWAGLGALVKVPGFGEQPQPCLVTLHKSQYEIIRNWNAFGLKGTGSHAVQTRSAFVPWERVLPLAYVKATGLPVGGEIDASAPIYRQPFMPAFLVGMLGLALGGAERVLQELIARTRQRQRVMYGVKEWESPVTQRNIAELHIKCQQIESAYERYVTRLERCVAVGEHSLPEREEQELGALRALAVREASELAFRAFELLGGAAGYSGDPIERFARDLFMARIHITQLYEDHMVSLGRSLFGLPASVIG